MNSKQWYVVATSDGTMYVKAGDEQDAMSIAGRKPIKVYAARPSEALWPDKDDLEWCERMKGEAEK